MRTIGNVLILVFMLVFAVVMLGVAINFIIDLISSTDLSVNVEASRDVAALIMYVASIDADNVVVNYTIPRFGIGSQGSVINITNEGNFIKVYQRSVCADETGTIAAQEIPQVGLHSFSVCPVACGLKITKSSSGITVTNVSFNAGTTTCPF